MRRKKRKKGSPLAAHIGEPKEPYLASDFEAPRKSANGRQSSVLISSDIGTPEREALEAKYLPLIEERPEFRRLVTYVPNKKIPVYNWFKFKEGFSRELVFKLLNHFKLEEGSLVLDPFAGCGTTLLACKEYGLPSVGIDILPIAVFAAKVKLREWKDLDEVIRCIDRLMSKPVGSPRCKFPDVRIVNLAFSPQVKKEILFYKEKITSMKSPVKDFLMLGLLSILEEVSYTSKDGQFLRLVEKPIPRVKDVLRRQLTQMVTDLCQRELAFETSRKKVKSEVFEGDAREPCLPKRYWGKVSAVVTSPPYLNRYDYSRTYALELCLLWVGSFEDLRGIRKRLLRSHIESDESAGARLNVPALDEILNSLSAKKLNNNRIPIMIKGYFEDMDRAIENLSLYLRDGGRVAMVVGNARFEGELVPTDLILCEIAKRHGFVTEAVWVTRYKGNSSQQMAKYGRVPVRESIILWKLLRGEKAK